MKVTSQTLYDQIMEQTAPDKMTKKQASAIVGDLSDMLVDFWNNLQEEIAEGD